MTAPAGVTLSQTTFKLSDDFDLVSGKYVLNATAKAKLEGIPVGNYTVTETAVDPDNYTHTATYTVNNGTTTDYTDGDDITAPVTKDADTTVAVMNTYTHKTADVQIKKSFTGMNSLPSGFKIEATYNDGTADRQVDLTVGMTGMTGIGTATDPYVWTISDLPTGTVVTFIETGYEDTANEYSVVTEKKADTDTDYETGNCATATVTENATHAAELKNTYTRKCGDLKVSKTVKSSTDADKTKEFGFIVTLTNGNQISGDYGDMTFTNGVATFTLKDGETKTAKDLPVGTTYSVQEEDCATEFDTVREGSDGTIAEGEQEAKYVNTRREGDLTVEKKLAEGSTADADKSFEMKITLSDTAVNGTYGDMNFTDGVAVIYVKAGEKKTARGLPANTGYTVEETEDPDYELESSDNLNGTIAEGNEKTAYLINKLKAISVKVKKVDVADGKELPGATIRILDEDGNVVTEWVSDDSEEGYEVCGLTIGKTYTLHEEVAPDGYTIAADTTFSIDGNGKINATGTVTTDGILLVEDAITCIKVKKVDVADGKELPGATIQILDEDGNVVTEWVSDDSEEGYEVRGLTIGKTYTLHEEVAPDGYTIAADTTFSIDGSGKITATGTVTTDGILLVEDAITCIKVKKVDVADGKELPGATIQILDEDGNVVTEWVSDDSEEGHEITGLITGKTYTLRETVAPHGYDVTTDTTFTIGTDGKATCSGSMTSEGILLVEDEMQKTQAAVRKIWEDEDNQDGVRPLTLTVNLLANGEVKESILLTAANGWSATVDDLPVVDDKLEDIEYTWEEDEVPEDYELSDQYTESILTTITNKKEVEKVSISVTKIWEDDDNAGGLRPESIQVQLYADGIPSGEAAILNEGNGWSYSWTELDKNKNESGGTGESREIVYTIGEIDVPEGYTSTVSGDSATGYVITNTLGKGTLIITKVFEIEEKEEEEEEEEEEEVLEFTDFPVTKIWDDDNNRDGKRPGSVTVHLYRGGEPIDSATLSDGNGWSHTFTNLQKYLNKKTIRYSVREDPVEGYTSSVNGNTITNKYTPKKTSATVRKVWNDNGKGRPDSIVVTLSNGKSVTLSASNGWMATITDLPMYENGREISYTWSEQEVPGYRQVSVVRNGTVTTITNEPYAIPKVEGLKPPKVPGETLYEFEDYDTALGVEVLINHVGDCFD